MIDGGYVRRMARYNRWQNQNLYSAADRLSDDERRLVAGGRDVGKNLLLKLRCIGHRGSLRHARQIGIGGSLAGLDEHASAQRSPDGAIRNPPSRPAAVANR